MGIPLAIFYFVYLGFVVVFLFFTFFNVYHLVRFGFLSLGNLGVISFYLLVSAMILSSSWYYLSQIDWSQIIPITLQVMPTI
ncbi:MAG: hypothetical protein RB292_05170 [Patescibacteria group bacterium]|jgi:hypothetical protein|nr:hypothetical protein [Patescibacteria group bacterium]